MAKANAILSPKRALERLRQHHRAVVVLAFRAAKIAVKHQIRRLGRFRPGNNTRHTRELKILRKVETLRHEYFPCGGETRMELDRLLLAAKHLVIAESARDPNRCVRSTRAAEFLLSRIQRQDEPGHVPLRDQLAAEAKR